MSPGPFSFSKSRIVGVRRGSVTEQAIPHVIEADKLAHQGLVRFGIEDGHGGVGLIE